MTCDQVRDALMEIAVDEIGSLEPHLSECEGCRALAERVRRTDAQVGRSIDSFADREGFDAAFARAVELAAHQPPAAPVHRGWIAAAVGIGLVVAAAAAGVLFVQSLPTNLGLPGKDAVAVETVSEPVDGPPAPFAPAVGPAAQPRDERPVELPQPIGTHVDLVQLEAPALLGRLEPDQIASLEALAHDVEGPLTRRDTASRMLMVNFFSAGETARWEAAIRYHLANVDLADPDLLYKLALHLAKRGPSEAEEVIELCERALMGRAVWKGKTYEARVYSLYKLRAAAGQKLWQQAESQHAEHPDDATLADARRWRAETGTYAREWLEYTRVVGKDTEVPYALCVSARDEDYCGVP
ncbi:MAG: hypothetical protein R3F61_20825 [Myxococcota bacterium]